ncbi:hypothetical protein ACWDUN_02790 [Mycobacterium sp. NPDC003323]
MKAHPLHRDDRSAFGDRRGVGVRATATDLLTYDLTVVATDVADVVRGAGGWLYDRVRAGWKVSVVVPGSCDGRPLDILGVRSVAAGRRAAELPSEPAALAVSARAFGADADLRGHVTQALERGWAEVTMWGDDALAAPGYSVENVQFRLSPAARAFKAHALAAAGLPGVVAPTEQFLSCALWYPADGPDLTAVR